MSTRNSNGDDFEVSQDGQASLEPSFHDQGAGALNLQARAKQSAGIRASWERFVDTFCTPQTKNELVLQHKRWKHEHHRPLHER